MKDAVAGMLEEHKKAPMIFNTQAGGMGLMDYQLYPDAAVLLVASAEHDIADPTMLNFTTRDTRAMRAAQGYQWAYSAHMFIGFKPMKTALTEYPAVLEAMPRLSRTAVADFLNKCLRRDKYQDSDGRPIWPGLRLTGDLSSRLKEALETGKLTGVDLLNVKPRQDQGPGETGFSLSRQALSFRRPRGAEERRAFSAHDKPAVLQRYKAWGYEHDYQMMRVYLERRADVPSHIDIATDDPELDTEKLFFIRRSTKLFTKKLDAAHKECVAEVISVGQQLLREQYNHKRKNST